MSPDPRSEARLPPICILAGGLGTRLGDRVRQIPKPLIEVAGAPFLVHQLRLLAAHGAREVVLCVGYLGEQIEACIGPERFGIEVAFSFDGAEPLGTLGAIRRAAPQLGERFLVLYGDTYLRIDYAGVTEAWRRSELPAVMTVLRNEGRWDRSNAAVEDGRVSHYDKKAPDSSMRWIDYGLGVLEASTLGLVHASETDLSTLYTCLAERGQLLAYEATERFYEIGSPSALAETDEFLMRHTAEAPSCGER